MSRAACCTLVCAGWALLGLGAARAQERYLKEDRRFDTGRIDALKAGLGSEGAPTAAQTEAAEICARYLVYRFTDPKLSKTSTPPGAINRLLTECEHWLRQVFVSKEATNAQMQALFRGKMLEALGQVLAPSDQINITRVNAARVLARLAALGGEEETAKLLLKVLKDPNEVDGARYWVLRGLKELLVRDARNAPAARLSAKVREQIAEALVQFIERKPALEKGTPEEELDGLRVVRREAIRALALMPEPLFAGNPRAHTALALLRVIRQDTELVPEPRIDERVEAAIGLASLRADPAYQPGYAAYHLAHFLHDFGEGFAKRIQGQITRQPWKIHAARLFDALRAMQAAFPNDPTVKAVVPQGIALTQAIEKQPANAGVVNSRLNKWLNDNPQPVVPSVYKGDAKAVVAPRAAEAP